MGIIVGAVDIFAEVCDLFEITSYVKACIPEHLRLTKKTFQDFLYDLKNHIKVMSFESVTRINYFYEITNEAWGYDTAYLDLHVDYVYEITAVTSKYYLADTLTGMQENTFFRGNIYAIKDSNDFEKAKNHVNYIYQENMNTSEDRSISIDNNNLPNYLHEGEYHWYKFTAPKAACYQFYSSVDNDSNNNLDPYCEIYERIIPANLISDEILVQDDNGGTGKNFKIFYYMLANQDVYIRVRGANWKTHGYYALNIKEFDENNLDVKYIQSSELHYACEYGGNSYLNKTINLDEDTPMYIKSKRCGYVKSEDNTSYLTLSCYKKGIREAFIYFCFDKPILRFAFDIGLWGPKEVIADGLADLTIGVIDSNDENNRFSPEMYRSISIDNLSKDRNNLDTKTYPFKESDHIYGVMIHLLTNMETDSTKNRGRIVIDNFYFGF